MKKLLSQVGFTLIELLVVISVIGVLAVAVLSSINPVEQINKGRDTGARSDAAQLINAVDRYYATQEKFPWNNTNTACSGAACPDSAAAAAGTGLSLEEIDPATEFPYVSVGDPNNFVNVCLAQAAGQIGTGLCQVSGTGVGGGWLTGLATTSEVKPAFVSRLQALSTYAIYVYKNPGADSTMFACFRPSSKAFQTEAVEKGCQDPNVVTGWGGMVAPNDVVVKAACPNGDATDWGTTNYVQSALHNELICLP